jgi:hypothetical protein
LVLIYFFLKYISAKQKFSPPSSLNLSNSSSICFPGIFNILLKLKDYFGDNPYPLLIRPSPLFHLCFPINKIMISHAPKNIMISSKNLHHKPTCVKNFNKGSDAILHNVDLDQKYHDITIQISDQKNHHPNLLVIIFKFK